MSIVDDLAVVVHSIMCGESTGTCARWLRDGSPHKDFYELRAQNLIAQLEPEIGIANVLPVVKAVLLEVGP